MRANPRIKRKHSPNFHFGVTPISLETSHLVPRKNTPDQFNRTQNQVCNRTMGPFITKEVLSEFGESSFASGANTTMDFGSFEVKKEKKSDVLIQMLPLFDPEAKEQNEKKFKKTFMASKKRRQEFESPFTGNIPFSLFHGEHLMVPKALQEKYYRFESPQTKKLEEQIKFSKSMLSSFMIKMRESSQHNRNKDHDYHRPYDLSPPPQMNKWRIVNGKVLCDVSSFLPKFLRRSTFSPRSTYDQTNQRFGDGEGGYRYQWDLGPENSEANQKRKKEKSLLNKRKNMELLKEVQAHMKKGVNDIEVPWALFEETLLKNNILLAKDEHVGENVSLCPTVLDNIILLVNSPFRSRPGVVLFHTDRLNFQKLKIYQNITFIDKSRIKKIVPKYILPESGHWDCVIKALQESRMKLTKNKKHFLLQWGNKMDQTFCLDLNKHQRVNFFLTKWEKGRKDNLWRNLRARVAFAPELFDFVPVSFLLGSEFSEWEKEKVRCRAQGKNTWWIVKPIVKEARETVKILKNRSTLKKTEKYMATKYIKNAHTLKNHKYDLRFYVLVASLDPLVIYIHEEGVVRLAQKEYDIRGMSYKDKHIHFTNCLDNKIEAVDDYGLSLRWEFWKYRNYLRFVFKHRPEVLFEQIDQLVVKTILGMYESMVNPINSMRNHVFNCFEVFGFDILVDESFKPWLLEVKANPSFRGSGEVDTAIKRKVASDTLTLIGVKLHPTISRTEKDMMMYFNHSLNKEEYVLEGYPGLRQDGFEVLLELEEQQKRKAGFRMIFPKKKYKGLFKELVKKDTRYNELVLNYFLLDSDETPLRFLKRTHKQEEPKAKEKAV